MSFWVFSSSEKGKSINNFLYAIKEGKKESGLFSRTQSFEKRFQRKQKQSVTKTLQGK